MFLTPIRKFVLLTVFCLQVYRHKNNGNAVFINVSASFKSARRDSNPKALKKAHKIKEECTLSSNCLQNEDSLNKLYKPIETLKMKQKQDIIIGILFFLFLLAKLYFI